MMLCQAERLFSGPLVFGDPWQIYARDLLRIKADIQRLRSDLLFYSCDWEDLPFKGRIYDDKDIEQMKILREIYAEDACVSLPLDVIEQLRAEGVL